MKKSSFNSIPRQTLLLNERHQSKPIKVECCDIEITVNPGVYDTSGDSELLAKVVNISKAENFLEIGCGSGIVSLVLAKRAKNGIGVDINDLAVINSKQNAKEHGINNIKFLKSNVFQNIKGKFDVIVCNPPYTEHEATDDVDRMFWDPKNEMKQIFFKEANKYLKPAGRIYFGWANFADIDINLPLKLAKENGYKLTRIFKKPHRKNKFIFFVFEFTRAK